MKQTLAYRMRPTKLSEVLGQPHLIGSDGILQKFVENKHPLSIILYGPPGSGKTTIATALASDLDITYRFFNASIGNKKELSVFIEEAKLFNTLLLIVDEVHRLNKDKQDYLLPYIEDGSIIMVGCTTANPYHAINPAVRSRCHILEVHPLDTKTIIEGLKRCCLHANGLSNTLTIDEEVYSYIATVSNGDIRYGYNALELCSLLCKDSHITISDVKKAIPKGNILYDNKEDQYYDTLSGLQKAIRGSDPNAALYYVAKLMDANDIESLERRLLTTAYEDIGLAAPDVCMRTVMAMQAARTIGFPEARIPIAHAVIDLCLAKKSKSGENAIDAALQCYQKQSLPAPKYLRLHPTGLEKKECYDYRIPEAWQYIQYLPDAIATQQFYIPWLTSDYEKGLAATYNRILKHGRTNDLPKLYELIKSQKKDSH